MQKNIIADVNKNKAIGESLDASYTTSFDYSPNVNVHEGGYEHCAGAQIIVITAYPSARAGENINRLALANTNVNVVEYSL